jgi:ATP-binding cassette subfamily C protein
MTVIVVTQKYSLLQDVDNIMMLADGQIAMFGSRDQMLDKLAERKRPAPGTPAPHAPQPPMAPQGGAPA